MCWHKIHRIRYPILKRKMKYVLLHTLVAEFKKVKIAIHKYQKT